MVANNEKRLELTRVINLHQVEDRSKRTEMKDFQTICLISR